MPAPILNANGLSPTSLPPDQPIQFKVTGQNLGDDDIRQNGGVALRTFNPAGISWYPVQSTDITNLVPDDPTTLYFRATYHRTGGPVHGPGDVQVTVTNGSGPGYRIYQVLYPETLAGGAGGDDGVAQAPAGAAQPAIAGGAPDVQANGPPHIGISQSEFTREESNPFFLFGDNMDDIDTANGSGSVELKDDFGNAWTDIVAKGIAGGNKLKIKGTPPAAPKAKQGGNKTDGGPSNTQVTVTNGSNQTVVATFPATYN